MSRPRLSPRDAARSVADQLVSAGHETYLAGGCVRDRLLGIEPTDFDLATDARPERVTELFPHARGVGAHFGVMLVPAGGRTIEVATFRSDGRYVDGRRPSEVSFGTAEADALRRDFTINGLFEHPTSGEVVDFVGGRSDLEAKVLRAIGDADGRIEEDRLRMLRAVRFAARFELEVEEGTRQAIVARDGDLVGVSRERVGHELRRMLGDPTRAKAAALAESLRLDGAILGAARIATGDGFDRIEGLPADVDWIDALVAWELDRGSAEARDSESRLLAALTLSNREAEAFRDILAARRRLLDHWTRDGIAARKRLAAGPAFERASRLVAIEDPEFAAAVADEVLELARTGLAPVPFIGGDDLVEAGLVPGPGFKAVLEATYDAQLEGRVHDREEALRFALGRAARDVD
ncbi:MAG: CCA tRNA nucleotidyltransferase [Planctomycetota bacterium]|nr:CCA tRNA nucleotidyltransferase [Planctomycetota bacterium]